MRPMTKITILGIRLGVAILAAYWLLIFALTHLPGHLLKAPPVSDKIKHATAFFALGLLMCYVTTSQQVIRRFGTILIAGIGYAALDEFSQGWVPGRVPDVWDFLADVGGLVLAIAIYQLGRLLVRPTLDRTAASSTE